MLVSVIIFSIIMSITPGPNNIMLTASGANYGFRRTVPHILGIEIGMLSMFALSAAGLGLLFMRIPAMNTALKYAGACYLLYLAGRIAFAERKQNCVVNSRPLNFLQAAAFQILNPKAYVIAVTGISTFSGRGGDYMSSVIIVMAVFAVVCIPCISLWAGFGTFISRFLGNNRVFRIFNLAMGGLVAASVVMIVF